MPTSSWGLDRIDQRDLPLDGLYSPPGSGAGVNLIIMGTGVRITHVDFGGRAVFWYDAVDGGIVDDCAGRGTLMGSVAGGTDWGAGKSTTVAAVRIADCAGEMQIPDVIDGLNAVAQMAGGGPSVAVLPAIWCDDEVNAAIQNLIDAGVTVVVPAGNDGDDLCRADCTPLAVPDAIVVGSVDQNDCRASFSDYGPGVDIFAPGVGVTGALYTDDFSTTTSSGNDLAASYVAGVAAVYLGEEPFLTPAQVQDRLLSRSTPIAGCGDEGTLRLVYTGLDDHPIPPPPPPAPGENPCPPCVEVETSDVLCVVDPVTGPTGEYNMTLNVTNNSGIEARYILLPGDVTDPDFIALPAPLPGDGATASVRVTLTGVAPLTDACFMLVLADANVDECCAGEEVCVTVPECDCLQATNAQLDCDPATGVVTLEFDLTNLTADDVEHVYVLPPLAPATGSDIEIPDSYFDIPTLLQYQTTHIGPVVLENAAPNLDVELRVTMHVETFEECCSEVLPITTPMCASQATLPDTGCEGDLDDDGLVGFSDLTRLLNTWGPGSVSDLDGDDEAGFSDLTSLLAMWGPCAN